MMHRRGGKRIRMDTIPPEFNEEGNDEDDDSLSPSKRMTRLRARGGVRDKPPIIDDDDEEEFHPIAKKAKKTPGPKKVPGEKPPRAERIRRENIEKERDVDRIDIDKDVTTDEKSLYFIIRHSRAAIATIVDDWIEQYKTKRDEAIISLMQFFINASGCKGKINVDAPHHMDHIVVIRQMTEEFDEESGEYPLIMPGQQWKKFKMHFCDFVQTLVRQCQYSIIYDQCLMDNVISLLSGLSDSQVRAFRHTATLAAMKLMTALVDVALLVSVNFDNTVRQYEAEMGKSTNKRVNDRLESLMTKRTELDENMDEIKNMLTYMFKSLFVHRYRDTLPDIRAICMTEIGVWMQNFPQNFLDDSYLKYIGWTLHDKVGEVRLRCLQALLPLYNNEDLKGKLELFTSKFKDRIVAMTLDKEFEVAVHAVKLVIAILKIHPDILTDKDCEIVYELVYSVNRGVAQAAAEFLNVRLFHLTDDAEISRTKRGKIRLPNTPLIRDLIQFFIESELHEHGAYLVDSFIDINPMVKDYECMTDLLLEEPGPNEEQLDNKQESTLIEIMVSSVKQCATGEPPVCRGSSRKVAANSKEQKAILDDKAKLTEHFIATLPLLLEKYQADGEKLNNLLSIPQYFILDIYTTSRQEAHLMSLLEKIAHIMTITTEREVLETCSKTLEYLCTEGTAIYTKCDIARGNIIDSCVNKYKEAIEDWRGLIDREEEPNEDEIYTVNISLKYIAILYQCHNLNPWNLFQSLYQDIKNCEDSILNNTNTDRGIPNEALTYCVEACFFSISWGLYHIENQCEMSLMAEYTTELKENLVNYMNSCFELIRIGPTPQVQESAYLSVCDLLIMFSDQLSGNENSHVRTLIYICSSEQLEILNWFIQEFVFSLHQEDVSDDERIEKIHKKRNFLSSFCKLVVYNIIPNKAAAQVYKHYLSFYNEYGDIIKATLAKAREMNKTNYAMTLLLSLISIFKEIQQATEGRINRNSPEFSDLKEIAKRFGLTFGLDAVRNREQIMALHRGGILYAVQDIPADPTAAPNNLSFLEVLSEFNNKLLKPDKKVTLSFLDQRISPAMPSSKNEDWQPLMNYRNSLLHGDSEQQSAPAPVRKVYQNRRRRNDDDDSDDDDDDLNDPDFRG